MNANSLIFAYCILAVVATCLCILVESTQSTPTVDVPVLNDVPVVVPTPPKIVAQNVSNDAPMPKNVSDPINYTTLYYNKTNIDTVSEFLRVMPEYPGRDSVCLARDTLLLKPVTTDLTYRRW